jgi:hypothetical protein
MKRFFLFSLLAVFINSCQSSTKTKEPIIEEVKNEVKLDLKINEKKELKTTLKEDLDLNGLRQIIWKDLKDFKQFKVYMQTEKFKIWIDQMEDGSYRYASWSISKSVDLEPDLILKNGTVNYEGSGGNHWYEFKNANTIYICDINVLGKSSNDAFLVVKQGEKIIVDQSAIFTSPLSKVISEEVLPKVLKNYEPGNYYYNKYSLVKSLYKEVLGNDDYPEGSSQNPSIEKRMFLISGINPVIGYDDFNIAHYNTSFIDWIAINLIPSKNFNIGNYSVKGYYMEKFSRFFRKLINIYWMLERKGFENEAIAYKDFYTNNEYGTIDYLIDLYAEEIVYEDINVASRKNYDINVLLAGFWLRRYLHNSSEEIYNVLINILSNFDSYWLKDAQTLANYSDLFIPNTEIQSEAIKFYKNNYKLVDYDAESTLEDEVDFNAEHPFSQITYKFEECDDTTTHRLFVDYIHDHVRPAIPLLNDAKWMAIESGSSLTINNPIPVSEFSWNSSLILDKDSTDKLKSISYANRGNGGGHKIEIQRWGNYCELSYYGFAD